MSVARRIAKNTAFLLTSKIVSYGAALIYSVLTVRYLGAAGYGLLSFALAFSAIFGIVIDFGLGTLTTREVARDRPLASKYLGNIVAIRVILGLVTISLVVVLVPVVGYSQQAIDVVVIIFVANVIQIISSSFYAVFQAFEKMEYQSFSVVLSSVLMVLGAAIGITLKVSIIGFAFIYLAANGAALVYGLIVAARKFSLPRLQIDRTCWKHVLGEAWPMTVTAMGAIIYFRVDAVILAAFQGAAQVGFYSIAYNLSETSTFIPLMFVASLFPLISKVHEDSKASFAETCAKSIKYLVYIAAPMAFFVTLWAKPLIQLLYGSAFTGSATALQIIIWAAAIMYVTIALATIFVATNLQRLSMKLTIGAAVFNIVLNLLLIPKYGYFGAAFTTVATEVFGLTLALFFLQRYGYDLNFLSASAPAILGLSIIAAVSVLLLLQNVPLLAITAIDLAIYAATIYKLGLKEEDKKLIASLVNSSSSVRPEA